MQKLVQWKSKRVPRTTLATSGHVRTCSEYLRGSGQFLTWTKVHHATPLITRNAKTSSMEAKPSAQDHICHIRTSSNIFLPFLQRRVYISLRKTTFDLRPGGSSVIYNSTQLDEIGKCLYVCVCYVRRVSRWPLNRIGRNNRQMKGIMVP